MKTVLRFLPALIWMLLIFFFSSRPTTGVAVYGFGRFLLFKAFHFLEYAILYVLFFYAFRISSYSFISAYFYAVTDEFHQSFTPARSPKFSDTLIDLFGIISAYLLLKYLERFPKIKRLFS